MPPAVHQIYVNRILDLFSRPGVRSVTLCSVPTSQTRATSLSLNLSIHDTSQLLKEDLRIISVSLARIELALNYR
jgi:hypothetical protein